MNRQWNRLAILTAFGLAASGLHAGDGGHDNDGGRDKSFSAQLKPTNEVPALSSVASGRFHAVVDELNQTITYELSYEDLEAAVQQAHIHIGQRSVNGGITVFLCGTPGFLPPATVPQPPACPTSPATVEGVITPANIIGPNGQGIAPTSVSTNEFAELVRAIRDRITYANVHTTKFPGGEIRGQLLRDRDNHHGNDD